LVLCSPQFAQHVFVEGQAIVRDGDLTNTDGVALAAQANALTKNLMS
jgi:hypothetical protein